MSYSSNYLPIPPRAWSRVQARCTFDTSSNDPFVFKRLAQLNKGNVLQYKKNSSQLTKQQRYSQIAKGLWTNRTKTWATQSDTYTNPNTTSLKRVGFVEYPRNDIIPGSPANISGPYVPVEVLADPFNCPNFTFKDGGVLVCGTYENPCTGEVTERSVQPKYYPTSDSDVPGPIRYLYWDPRLQTWFPRQRLTMNNSTNKWPTNYKLFRSAIQPSAPTLEIVSSTTSSVELAWTIGSSDNRCYPASNFSIFVDNTLYKTIINSTNYTTTLTGLSDGPYQIFIVSVLSGNTSPPSNVVVYNNDIVVKQSLAADNKTYSDGNTDLSNEISDVASGNISGSIVSDFVIQNGSTPAPAPAPAPGLGSGGGGGGGDGGGGGGGGNLSLDSNTKVEMFILTDSSLKDLTNSNGEIQIPNNYGKSSQPFTMFNNDPENALLINAPNGAMMYNSTYARGGVSSMYLPASSLATFTSTTNNLDQPVMYVSIT